jgi:hypothetical protein
MTGAAAGSVTLDPAAKHRRDRTPALLLLAACGATVRSVIGLVSGSTFAYFIQPARREDLVFAGAIA